MPDAESGGLGFPRMADRMEYSRFAASEPKAKLGSKGTLKRGSFVENGSAAEGERRSAERGEPYMWVWGGDRACCRARRTLTTT